MSDDAEPYAEEPTVWLASTALVLAIGALVAALFVGWAFPLGLIALGLGIAALRRAEESRAAAIWAIGLAALSVLYSAGWLVWAATR